MRKNWKSICKMLFVVTSFFSWFMFSVLINHGVSHRTKHTGLKRGHMLELKYFKRAWRESTLQQNNCRHK